MEEGDFGKAQQQMEETFRFGDQDSKQSPPRQKIEFRRLKPILSMLAAMLGPLLIALGLGWWLGPSTGFRVVTQDIGNYPADWQPAPGEAIAVLAQDRAMSVLARRLTGQRSINTGQFKNQSAPSPDTGPDFTDTANLQSLIFSANRPANLRERARNANALNQTESDVPPGAWLGTYDQVMGSTYYIRAGTLPASNPLFLIRARDSRLPDLQRYTPPEIFTPLVDGIPSTTRKPLDYRAIRDGLVAALMKADDLGMTKLTVLVSDRDQISFADWQFLADPVATGAAPALANMETLELVWTQPSRARPGVLFDAADLIKRADLSMVLKRFALRRPAGNRDAFIPARVADTRTMLAAFDALEQQSSNNTVFDTAFDQVFSPVPDTSAMQSFLPLMIGILALFLTQTGRVVIRARQTKPGFIPSPDVNPALRMALVVSTFLASWFVMVWASWALPVNWLPDGTPFMASIWAAILVWTLPVLVGAGAGYFAVTPLVDTGTAETGGTKQRPREPLLASLLNDNPVTDMRRHDQLGTARLVDALRQLLDNRDTRAPLAISVNGPWGSGKTSIMKMLETELKRTRRFQFVWFNAWQYRTEEQILQAFLAAISDQLTRHQSFWFTLKMCRVRWKYATDLKRLGYLISTIAVISGLTLASTAAWDQYQQRTDTEVVTTKGAGQMGRVTKPDTGPTEKAKDTGDKTLENAVKGATGGGLSVGFLLLLSRLILPFQKPLKSLFSAAATGADGGDASHVDRFNREFMMVREALGKRKFLVFIDDLDRCGPDQIVEVLKTVNLISTAPAGAGRTFFVLGFDWHFVTSMIELHFKELIEKHGDKGTDFAREYLKKIVTLSLSVPEPSRQRLADLAQQRGNNPKAAQPAQPGRMQRLGDFTKRAGATLQAFLVRPINWLIIPAVIWGLVLAWDSAEMQDWRGIAESADTSVQPELTFNPLRPVTPGSSPAGLIDQLPALADAIGPAEQAAVSGGTSVSAADLAIFGTAGFFGLILLAWLAVLAGGVQQRRAAPPEPEDPLALENAVRQISDHLPRNPRDVVRLVNLVRVAYLLQAAGDGDDDAMAPRENLFTGTPFTAEESVRLSLWYYQHARVIDAARINDLMTDGSTDLFTAVAGRVGEERKNPEEGRDGWYQELLDSIIDVPGLRDDLRQSDKLDRFLEIYRNLLRGA